MWLQCEDVGGVEVDDCYYSVFSVVVINGVVMLGDVVRVVVVVVQFGGGEGFIQFVVVDVVELLVYLCQLWMWWIFDGQVVKIYQLWYIDYLVVYLMVFGLLWYC